MTQKTNDKKEKKRANLYYQTINIQFIIFIFSLCVFLLQHFQRNTLKFFTIHTHIYTYVCLLITSLFDAADRHTDEYWKKMCVNSMIRKKILKEIKEIR